jgi:hypothetical protein
MQGMCPLRYACLKHSNASALQSPARYRAREWGPSGRMSGGLDDVIRKPDSVRPEFGKECGGAPAMAGDIYGYLWTQKVRDI